MTDTKLRIMYVEDEEDIRTIARISLERIGGFEVELCDGGPMALRRVGAFRPDIIILDVMMPGMDGLETMAALRDRPDCSSVPIVFMTAKVQRSEMDHYLQAGAAAVIPKPFDPMDLPREVRRIWLQTGTETGASADGGSPPSFAESGAAHVD